jgi:hypothetical protein
MISSSLNILFHFSRDGLCMIFLLLQKRRFGSYYWVHILSELRSQANPGPTIRPVLWP